MTVAHELPLIARLLRDDGVLTEDQLDALPKLVAEHPDSLEEGLVLAEFVGECVVAETHARHLGLPWLERIVDEADEKAARGDAKIGRILEHPFGSDEAVAAGTIGQAVAACRELAVRISENVCRNHRVIPVRRDEKSLELGCLDPSDFAAVEEVAMRSGLIVRPVAVTLGLLGALTSALFGERDVVREIASEASGGVKVGADDHEDEVEVVLDLARPIPSGRDSQVVRIVNVLLSRSIEEGASDIHIEPYEDAVRVRYRIDGKLVETTPPPRSLFIPTISRLKILAKMDIAEKRIPQDGAIALKSGDKRVDLRVSTVPTVYGEKMVIRLLEKEGIPDRLEKLGFAEDQAEAFVNAARAPNGLMFVTGPTGSGKSTTLYCCLNLINEPTENIVTVEDPVEYKFFGLNQVHVRSQVGLTFASALRSFLRQDPDKIMVGEVRDQETAQICMRAALTGHLVLSTLHTNNSLQVINRLVDMGIEPFLLGPALRLLEAQRLARKLCPDCKVPYELPEQVAERHGLQPGVTLYRKGNDPDCTYCRGNGTKGRVGIYEVVPIGEKLGELIASQAPLQEVEAAARKSGVRFLPESARLKLVEGVVALEDVAEYVRVGT